MDDDLFEDEHEDVPSQKPLKNLEVLSFLFAQWMRRPIMFGAIVVFSLLTTFIDITIPIAAGHLIDVLNKGEASESPWPAYAVFIGLAIALHASRQAMVRNEIPFSSANMADMTSEAFAKVQKFSLDWHANTFAGSVVRKITRGMWAYDTITATFWFSLLPSILVMFGLGIYMALNWVWVGVYGLSVIAFFMVANLVLAQYYIRPQNLRANAKDSELGGALADAMTGIATVKSFGSEAREHTRFYNLAWDWRAEAKKNWTRFVNTWLLQNACVVALQAGLVGFLILLWQKGNASAGDVVFAITAFMLMSGYMRRFGEEVQNVQRSLDEIQDIAAYNQTPEQIKDKPKAPKFKPVSGRIEFKNVDFGYEGQETLLYEGFNLSIEPGEKVALVGPTGSGKSTFVKLVQRLYDINNGHVEIDGQDVRDVTQASLRRHIALVPQDPVLFHRSIEENIAYGRPKADHKAIVEAAERARAHDFIMNLPKGYKTLVGERGVKLSGGERQRVAIARAILSNAPILIFDEATSSLDNETERQVQEAMAEVTQGKTAIIIAHRLSTIRDADRILVFDQGRIVEQGTHDELTGREDGLYARLAALANS
ncbi:ABC transporter ATP-binding protein [Woodsholea maritima]|uniref:ABC transporter ATP-binding protein n=1 Tax=Woodsholea maritima TaxID=240237 RepID=UPI00035C79A0|nr:ABC transporter ATP-binding protein [Woodsholea maritima]